MKAIRIIGKAILIFIPLILIWAYIAIFPADYMDGEYSYFTQAKDYLNGKSDLAPADILILGDSRAKSAFIPEQISDSCISLAQGGTTSVEAYYTLKDHIENRGKPKAVILSVCSFHFTDFDGFWTRSIYFDYLSFEQANEVIREAGRQKETDALRKAGGDSVFTLLEYKIKSPTKYMSPVVNSVGEGRKALNRKAYEEMEKNRGFKTFVSWWPTSTENDMEKFVMLRTLDTYYRKTIELCIENDIEVFSLNAPLIDESYGKAMKTIEPFRDYFVLLSKEYPDAHIDTEFASYPAEYFDDADHLNKKGAEKYTAYIAETLFQEELR